MQVVTAAFHDQESVSHAIRRLADAGVPIDEISVTATGLDGERSVPIWERDSVVTGAVAGGAIGAVLGGLGAALAATGIVVGPGAALLASGPVLTALRGIVGGAGFGYGLGVLGGLDYWKLEAHVHAEDLTKGAVLVTVHSTDLHDTAREVFQLSGADRVTG